MAAGKDGFDAEAFKTMQENGPRQLGIGVYRFRQSRNSI
jgi:putative protease